MKSRKPEKPAKPKIKILKRNPVAKALTQSALRPKTVPSKKIYKRNKRKAIARS